MGSPSALSSRRLWPTPQHNPEEYRVFQLRKIPEFERCVQLNSVTFNAPNVQAYSFYWNFSIITMHAHSRGDSFHSVLSDPRVKGGVWLYMPLDDGEHIVEIWKRKRKMSREVAFIVSYVLMSRYMILMSLKLRTNRNRIGVMGAYPKRAYLCRAKLLDCLAGAQRRVFFDRSHLGIHEVHMANHQPSQPTSGLQLPTPLSAYPRAHCFEEFFYTEAPLSNTTRVAVCRIDTYVSGLLLCDRDGHLTHVGQIRRDCLQPWVHVKSSESMWMGFLQRPDGPYVSSIEWTYPTSSNLFYLEVRWQDRLEWWFSYRQCQVYHNGQLSPSTVRGIPVRTR